MGHKGWFIIENETPKLKFFERLITRFMPDLVRRLGVAENRARSARDYAEACERSHGRLLSHLNLYEAVQEEVVLRKSPAVRKAKKKARRK